jgi:hypothetical protein
VKFADDLGCIATLGTDGCGFEEQLEAPFKALMPSMPDDASGTPTYTFLIPSCTREAEGESQPSVAYPPRRIVELAKLFGENGMVQSICQDDFMPAMKAITEVLATRLGAKCLPNVLRRHADGRVPCDVLWELPKVAIPGSGAPTACDDLPFLQPIAGATNAAGGQNCKLTQLAIDDESQSAPAGDGWFYDDYTDELKVTCRNDQPQRIAFSPNAKPPAGVKVRLDCQATISPIPNQDNKTAAVKQPEIGSACGPLPNQSALTGDDACAVQRRDGTTDTAMFCHPNLLACVRGCQDNRECPSGWSCDSRPETLRETGNRAYCVNPNCAPLH